MLLSSRWTWLLRAYEGLFVAPVAVVILGWQSVINGRPVTTAAGVGVTVLLGAWLVLTIWHSDLKAVRLEDDHLELGYLGRRESIPLIQARVVGPTSAYFGQRWASLPVVEMEYVDLSGQRREFYFRPRSEASQALLDQAIRRSNSRLHQPAT